MKFLLLILVFFLITTSARKLASEQGDQANIKINNIRSSIKQNSVVETQIMDSFPINQMGLMEVCGNEDEECLKRRALAEAHLDYIYTEHHKP